MSSFSEYKLPQLLDGEKQLYKDTLKALEASYRVVKFFPAPPPAPSPVRLLSSPGGGGSVGRVQSFAPVPAPPGRHPEPEDSLLLWDPGPHLAMSAYQVKTLDDLFASLDRKGAKDLKTGRFVGFTQLIKPLTFARPLGVYSGDIPLAEASEGD